MNAAGEVVARVLSELPRQDRSARFDGFGSAFIVVIHHERVNLYSAALYTPDARGGWVAMAAAQPVMKCAVLNTRGTCTLWIGAAGFRLRDSRQARDAARFIGVEMSTEDGEGMRHVSQ